MPDTVKEIKEGAEKVTSAIETASKTLTDFSKLSISNSASFAGLIDAFEGITKSAGDVATAFSKIPGVGGTLGTAIDLFQNTGTIITKVAQAAEGMAKGYDGLDKGTRELIDTQYGYAASLGQTFDQAVKNKDAFNDLTKANSNFADAAIFLNSDDFKKGIAALQSAGISMQDLGKSSGVATNGMNNMQAMTMQARAMGMDISTYSSKMASMVRKSGLSIEDSMKLMASSQSIASETGLKVDEVTSSLENAVSGFQKMGATMDFGRPVLRGFADSVKEVGLGIEQAGDLASDFSKSLLGIVNNPALAYVTAMKGGFAGAMGGPGGALNPSIQMQAMMLDKEPGAQAELARSLSTGMKEMLTSQTGGQIITVKEAAAGDAGTQSQFYAQQQMLGSLYGISDTTTQSRVLEYLSDLEKATAEGDQEQIDKINQQITDATRANDKTLDIQQKISLSLDKSVVLMQEQLAIAKADFIKSGGEASILEQIQSLSKKYITEDFLGEKDEKKIQNKLDEDIASSIFKVQKKVTTPQEQPPQEATRAGERASAGTSSVEQSSKQLIQSELNLNISHPKDMSVEVVPGKVSAAPGTVKVTSRPR